MCSCTNTHPLLFNNGESYNNFSQIKIKAPSPQIEYSLRRKINNGLRTNDLGKYNIKINIEEEADVAAFSGKEVIKEQKRLVASVIILDRNYNEIYKTKTDAFSTYEINDNAPLASLSSEEHITNLLIQNLAEESIKLINKFVKQ